MEYSPTVHANRLQFFGLLLFLFGLTAGLFIPMMANHRMGLSTHLEGVMNGIFLMVLGLLWSRIRLPRRGLDFAYWLAVYGSFANFTAVLLSAMTGAGAMMPIAGGKEGISSIEGIISFLLVSLALAMVAVCVLVLYGLRGSLSRSQE